MNDQDGDISHEPEEPGDRPWSMGIRQGYQPSGEWTTHHPGICNCCQSTEAAEAQAARAEAEQQASGLIGGFPTVAEREIWERRYYAAEAQADARMFGARVRWERGEPARDDTDTLLFAEFAAGDRHRIEDAIAADQAEIEEAGQ